MREVREITKGEFLICYCESGWIAMANGVRYSTIHPTPADAVGEALNTLLDDEAESAKLSGLDPQAYLADVLARINDHINPRGPNIIDGPISANKITATHLPIMTNGDDKPQAIQLE